MENRPGAGAGRLPALLPASNDYITPATRGAFNLPNPLFTRAVGDQGGVAGNNGQIGLATCATR